MKTNDKKVIGCTVEHKWTGALAICDNECLMDDNWIFYDERAVVYE